MKYDNTKRIELPNDDYRVGNGPLLARLQDYVDRHNNDKKVEIAKVYRTLFEVMAAMFIGAAYLIADEGITYHHDAGMVCIAGIGCLVVAGLLHCRIAWLRTPSPEEPNV